MWYQIKSIYEILFSKQKGSLLTICCLAMAHGLPVPVSKEFNHRLQLDSEGKYIVHWKFNTTHITFEVHVETRGYIGFGISPNGMMAPSDVIVGWVKNGQTHFSVSYIYQA